MKIPAILGVAATYLVSPLSTLATFAEENGPGPHIREESHGREGLPITIIIAALIIAVGLAYGIGRRSRK